MTELLHEFEMFRLVDIPQFEDTARSAEFFAVSFPSLVFGGGQIHG
jgi:hypothetical protein